MSCTYKTRSARLVLSIPRAGSDWPAIISTMIAITDAFREALEMRRAAHQRYFFDDE